MANSPLPPSSDSSSDISVSLDAESIAKSVNASTSDRNSTTNMPWEIIMPEQREVGHSPCSSAGKIKQNDRFCAMAARFFDEKVPERKKVKWLKQVAMVKDDGTVAVQVPADIKPQCIDFGTTVMYNEESGEATDVQNIPPLQIVMLIVGTRGDVQPFVAIGKRLQEYGHRVRLATHKNFKDFVLNAGLEFFPLGGDPKILAGYMVKHKGFLPSDLQKYPFKENK